MDQRVAEPYVVRCLFCRCEHRSFYWDELEEEIMRCRERADRRALGLLRDYFGGERIQKEGPVEDVEGPCFLGV